MNRRLLIAIIAGSLVGVIAIGGLVWWLRSRNVDGIPSTPSMPTGASGETEVLTGEVPPKPIDSDSDGLSDDDERLAGTDPLKQDSDEDGFTDYFEVVLAMTDPLSATSVPSDRARDESVFIERDRARESATTTQPPAESPPVQVDADGDGLTDQDEVKIGTDPNNPDSDGDGLTDGQEVGVYQTNPLSADSDGDGFQDADEINNGYNPRGPGRCEKPDCSA